MTLTLLLTIHISLASVGPVSKLLIIKYMSLA